MHNLKEVQQNYLSQVNEHDVQEKDFDIRLQQINSNIEKLQKKYSNVEKKKNELQYPYWTENLLRPILDIVAKERPLIQWDFQNEKKLNTFGMRAECPVFGYYKGACIISLTFTPTDIKHGIISMDNGEYDGVRKDTLHDLNNFGNKRDVVVSIKQILAYVDKQFKENTENCFHYGHSKFVPYKNLKDLKSAPVLIKQLEIDDFNYNEFIQAAKDWNIQLTDFLIMNDGIIVYQHKDNNYLISYKITEENYVKN